MALEVMDLVAIKIRGQFYVYKGRRLPGQTLVYVTVNCYGYLFLTRGLAVELKVFYTLISEGCIEDQINV